MSCLFDPLLQSDSLRLFMRESPAPLQTSFQYEGWRGIKREEGGAGEGNTEEPCTSENLEELGLKAMEILGG